MTRRCLTQLLISGVAGVGGCAPKGRPEVFAKVQEMSEKDELAIVGGWRAVGPGNLLVPEARTVTGDEVGKLILTPRPLGFSVAPDGGCVAWTTHRAVGGTDEPSIFFTDDRGSSRRVSCKGHFGRTAISSRAERIAVIGALGEDINPRLMVLNQATGKVEHDVTEFITRFPVAHIGRLQISANGNRLAVASSKSFAVVDLPSRKLLLEGDGQFSSLSPQGEMLACLDNGGELVLTSLATRTGRTISNAWGNVIGVGGWSPDGRFLFAGASPFLTFRKSLLAIDTATGQFARIMRLEMEGDHGETCLWIKRQLLSG